MYGIILHDEHDPPYLAVVNYYPQDEPNNLRSGLCDHYHISRHHTNPNRITVSYPHEPEHNIFTVNRQRFIRGGDKLLNSSDTERYVSVSTPRGRLTLESFEEFVIITPPCGDEYEFEREEFKWLLDALEFDLTPA